MGTISDTTHFKTMFSFWPGTDKHFIGNALCCSDGSVTQLLHSLHFFTINNVFQKKLEKIQTSKTWRQGDRESVPPPPISYPAVKKLPILKGPTTTGEMRW
jgi:hypothetical protein